MLKLQGHVHRCPIVAVAVDTSKPCCQFVEKFDLLEHDLLVFEGK